MIVGLVERAAGMVARFLIRVQVVYRLSNIQMHDTPYQVGCT